MFKQNLLSHIAVAAVAFAMGLGQSSTPVSAPSSPSTVPAATTFHHQSLAKQIQFADAAALQATGGGSVVSIASGSWQQTPVWLVKIAQSGSTVTTVVDARTDTVLATRR